jgi:N-acetylglucosaminyldiphosphoundecaprenol N-acetyl-beta-D-mannosaminyltransferase
MPDALPGILQGRPHCNLLDINFSSVTLDELVGMITHADRCDGVHAVFTANVDNIANLTKSEKFRIAYSWARTITIDGSPVWLYASLRRAPIPEKITGAELFDKLMFALRPGHRVFFVCSSVSVGENLREWLIGRGFEPNSIAFSSPPFGFESDNSYTAMLARSIREHGSTHLLFCLGSPKSEIWVFEHRMALGSCYALCLGAAAEFFTGKRRRAPMWMRRCGFEWAFRFAQEPRRLFYRYFINSWRFLMAVLIDL